MMRDVMILMRENPFRGQLEEVCPENRNKRRECHLGPEKSRFQGPPLPVALVMDFPHQNHEAQAPYKKKN